MIIIFIAKTITKIVIKNLRLILIALSKLYILFFVVYLFYLKID